MTPKPHAESYYLARAVGLRDHPALAGEAACDVCVVGGGYTGLSAALHLAERGYDVVLLEAERIAWGASGRNGGQLGSGQRKRQAELEALVGREAARRLWDLAEEAKATVKGLIERHAIPCDLKPGILQVAWKPGHAAWLAENAAHLQERYGYAHARAVPRAELAGMLGTSIYHGGLIDSDAAHLHPLNYALGLARAAEAAGVRIFEDSRALSIGQGRPPVVATAQGRVTARHVVIACNGYLERLEPRIAGLIMPINNFILATEPLGEDRARALIRDDVAVCDTKFVIDYYRLSADTRLLFGGGESYRRGLPRDIAGLVRRHMLRIFPQLSGTRIDYAWGGTLAITLNRLPCFGRLAPETYYALGYSGHGLGLATLAGKLIAEALAGQAERFDVMARLPRRRFPGGTLLRWPGLVLGMLYYGLRDRL
ncbi:MAG TPA: FAD-binding oxidoreductase [Kiloniellales bacterium]|nr:FAD-binding oxidoreductase [Kiloniellales bacterium]